MTIKQRVRGWLRVWLGIEFDNFQTLDAINTNARHCADLLEQNIEIERRFTGRCDSITQLANVVKLEAESTAEQQTINVQRLKDSLVSALTDLENTRQDLIQRMADLEEEWGERKAVVEAKQKADEPVIVSPARKTFSQRRREAQGDKRNMAAYVVPKKPAT